MTKQTLLETIEKSTTYAIYGAQVVAYGLFTALRGLFGISPQCFIVSRAEGNPAEIEGVPVRAFDDCLADERVLSKDALILVAVTELLQDEICAALETAGCSNYLRIGAHAEHLIMGAYFDKIGMFPLLGEKSEGSDKLSSLDLAVYEAKNHRDKPLANPPTLKPWERTIQAGADVTDMRIAELLDNTGGNISFKNKMYSEMTATYWVWKNTTHDWKGICHYRRHFALSDAQLAELMSGGVDALLPLPYICYPNTLAQFGRFVSGGVVDALLGALQELHPDKYEQYHAILNARYQYTYNLLIARREVFDEYCAWAFEVLGEMERYTDKAPEIPTTRALSYAAEVVTSLYFLSNSDKLRIKHIEKSIFI